jgi:fructose-bisphosphate aldolase class II
VVAIDDMIATLAESVPVPLVLHGSSGVPDDQLRRAVRAGMVKVNVGTALNVAFTRAIRDALVDDMLVDPRTYLSPARELMACKVQLLMAAACPTIRDRSPEPA